MLSDDWCVHIAVVAAIACGRPSAGVKSLENWIRRDQELEAGHAAAGFRVQLFITDPPARAIYDQDSFTTSSSLLPRVYFRSQELAGRQVVRAVACVCQKTKLPSNPSNRHQ